jgi:hypothetical protein
MIQDIFGMRVNVLANVKSGTGIETTVRRYVRALESIGARVQLIDGASSHAPRMSELPDVNLICGDIAMPFTVLSKQGRELRGNAYNIGLWLWELGTFPQTWCDRFAYFDEIWAPTSFLANTFSPVSPVPVVRVPHVLEPDGIGVRERGRLRLGLHAHEFTYAFIFNFQSGFERKNPLAVIDSFKAAFQPHENARLVIKCLNADFRPAHFAEMQSRAQGYPITICAGHWTAQEVEDLITACDCYVSLHRAEGVGLTISDSMAAGKPVIATGWSGNMDFMNVSNSFPVRYQLVELGRRIGYYRPNDVWAEPSLRHATEQLRYVFDHRTDAAAQGAAAKQDIEGGYSRAAVGKVISLRLTLISQRHAFRRLQDRLSTPIQDVESSLREFAGLGEYVPQSLLRYEELIRSVRGIVRRRVPRAATVMVISKGDEELLQLDVRQAWHFPQSADRTYAGHHPRDSEDAIRILEEMRADGGDFLVLPSVSFWWLDYYQGFAKHLRRHYSLTHHDENCLIFQLSGGVSVFAAAANGESETS